MIPVKVKKLHPNAVIPTRQSQWASGVDLHAVLSEPVRLYSETVVLIPTGLAIQLPPGFEAQIRPRSGLAAKEGVTVVNSPGTIDSDYRGEIKIILTKHLPGFLDIHPGDRIAQLVVAPILIAQFEEVTELDATLRGTGGFGSTGVSR